MTGFADSALATHNFLDGRVRARQPRAGYRSGVDAVYLAAAAPAKPGQTVLDLGTGAGVAALCLGARVAGISLHGLEIDADYAALAESNGVDAGTEITIWCGNVADPPSGLRALSFDGVIANPPYFRSGAYLASDAKGHAHSEVVPLSVWIDCALRRLKPGGWLAIIQRAERLSEIITSLAGRAGDIRIKPIAGRAGRDASRVLVTARKGGKGPLVLAAPLIEHAGAAHLRDGDDFTDEARAILRDGAALAF